MYSAPWRNPCIVLTLSGVFLCGLLTGVLVTKWFSGPKAAAAPYWQESGKQISVQRFKKELNLTPAQAAEVEMILDDFVKYYQTLQAQMDDVRATGKERIRRILTPEQKEKFERMMSELQARQLR
jgi:Spy/CpxP family protein refolding chaperone